MRLKLKLKATESPAFIPINYQYYFSSSIYLLLKFGSSEFSEFLHETGYKLNGKKFKMFVFGLKFRDAMFDRGYLKLLKPECDLIISSPFIDSFIKNFVIGTFEKQNIFINYDWKSTKFYIHQAEIIPSPTFSSETRFNLVSPLAVSTMVEKDGKLKPYYFRYDDVELTRVLKNNLLSKYKLVHKREIEPSEFNFEFDRSEIESKKGKVSKLITIAENTPQQTRIKAIQCGFKIKTDPELIKIGYECGFGEKNSMGFGLAEVVK